MVPRITLEFPVHCSTRTSFSLSDQLLFLTTLVHMGGTVIRAGSVTPVSRPIHFNTVVILYSRYFECQYIIL